MNEIKCPNCGEKFLQLMKKSQRALSQVRSSYEIHERIRQELALVEQRLLTSKSAEVS